jgi:hypothetical protein
MLNTIQGNRRFYSSNILPMFALGTLGIQALLLLLVFVDTARIGTIAAKPVPNLVQLVDGHSVTTEPVDPNMRTPQVIQQFVKTSLGMMFSWSGKVQVAPNATSSANSAPAATSSSNAAPAVLSDPGVPVDSGRVTTASWQASFALKEDFRNSFLSEIAKLTPSAVFSSNAQSVLNIDSISEPKLIKSGEWQVDVVANLIIFDGNHPQGMTVPFNKSVFVDAIEPAQDPLPDTSTPLQKAVYQLRENGLQISLMRDLDVQQLTTN